MGKTVKIPVFFCFYFERRSRFQREYEILLNYEICCNIERLGNKGIDIAAMNGESFAGVLAGRVSFDLFFAKRQHPLQVF